MNKRMITAITPRSDFVEVDLACGHTIRWFPFSEQTPQQLAEHMQNLTPKPIQVGKTKLNCKECTQ
jgi:hypothetical protein